MLQYVEYVECRQENVLYDYHKSCIFSGQKMNVLLLPFVISTTECNYLL